MPISPDPATQVAAPAKDPRSWQRQFWSVVFLLFCFEMGIFLLVFPWLHGWNNNSVADAFPGLRMVWGSGYFRGAVSGLGLANLLVSFAEIGSFRRV